MNQLWSLKKAKEAAAGAAKKAATVVADGLAPNPPNPPLQPDEPIEPATPQYNGHVVLLGICGCATSIAGLVWLGQKYGLWAFLGQRLADLWSAIRGQLVLHATPTADVEKALEADSLPNATPSQVEAPTPLETLQVEVRPPLEVDERLPVQAEIREAVEADIRPPIAGPPPQASLTFEVEDRILRPNARGRRPGYNIYSRQQQPKKAARGRRGRRHHRQ